MTPDKTKTRDKHLTYIRGINIIIWLVTHTNMCESEPATGKNVGKTCI